jgi:ribonuclease P protein component
VGRPSRRRLLPHARVLDHWNSTHPRPPWASGGGRRRPRLRTNLEPSSEQAHVPAQQTPPGEDPRVPAANAYSRRPGDHLRAQGQGPDAAQRLTIVEALAVLPARHRLRRRADLRATATGGRRAGRRLLAAHLSAAPSDPEIGVLPAKVGFAVGRSVGGAVVRNAVRRRLRHLMRERIERLPPGTLVIIRALPPSACASSAELGADLDAVLERLMTIEGGRPSGGRAVTA